ncbi:MAG: GNAT family protein [Desulfovibrionaceae bacterium]
MRGFAESSQANDLEGLRLFIEACRADDRIVFAGIFLKADGSHVGNIKLGPIDPVHKTASIGIIIGEKDQWGKGLATEAIRLMADYAFTRQGVLKLTAGSIGSNKGSIKAFLHCGFEIEGVQRSQLAFEEDREDKVYLGKVKF